MSKQKINIGGDKQDVFYRYKRPIIEAKVEKPGTNGVKTIIINMTAIAAALNVPPEYPTKFFGYELGSQASYMVSSDRTCAIVKGSHTIESLERILEEFIRIFVSCPKCNLPEIQLSINKSNVRMKCAACGFEGGLPKSHRLENFILKNPPQPKRKEKLQEEANDMILPEETPEKAWMSDSSVEGQKERLKEFLAEKSEEKSGKLDKEISKEPGKYQVLKKYVNDGASATAILSEMNRLQLAHSMSMEDRNRILLLTLIDFAKPLGVQFAKQGQVLQKFVNDKKSGILMLSSIEQFLSGCTIENKDVPKKPMLERIPVVLDKLYQAGVLTEDVILEWWRSPPEASSWAVSIEHAKLTRKSAQPFIEWLQTTEEE